MCVVFPIGLRQNKRVLGLEGGKKPLQGLRNLRFTYPNIGDSQPLKTWPGDHKNADQNEANLLARNVLRKAVCAQLICRNLRERSKLIAASAAKVGYR